MSLAGRRFLDGIKRKVGSYVTMPSPAFGKQSYWNSVYQTFGEQDVFEWGDISFEDLREYKYRGDESTNEQSTLESTINVNPGQDKSVMILGCGYSRLGQDMADVGGWKRIIQVDSVSKVISDAASRCSRTECIEDDATSLSAFNHKSIDAVIDKGLIDTLYLASEDEQITNVMDSIHRILRPNGTFVTFSLSEPAYFADKLVPKADLREERWSKLEVRQLETSLLYRIQKADDRGGLILSNKMRKKSPKNRSKR